MGAKALYIQRKLTIEGYVRKQTAFALNAAIQPTFRDDYDIFSKGETIHKLLDQEQYAGTRQGYSFPSPLITDQLTN